MRRMPRNSMTQVGVILGGSVQIHTTQIQYRIHTVSTGIRTRLTASIIRTVLEIPTIRIQLSSSRSLSSSGTVSTSTQLFELTEKQRGRGSDSPLMPQQE